MKSTQRYVLASSRVLVAMIFLLNGVGIISQAVAAKELIEHGAPASLVPFLMSTTEKREGSSQIRACVLISGVHRRWKGRTP